ncbi:CHASE3 domain-containing protein [Flavobacterium sp.]|uniref:CHASE3 domain-containing protein n=1 Tax=Flavobacterium sp. TaxID=239 RepID=UPI00375299A9
MKFKDILNSSWLLKIFFIVSVFFLIFIYSINYRNEAELTSSSKWLMHTYKVQTNLQNLHFNIKDAESNVRGYVITKDSMYYKNVKFATQKIYFALYHLNYILSDNPTQLSNLTKLKASIEKRLVFYKSIIELNKNKPPNSPQLMSSMVKGKILMNSIDTQINKMLKVESDILKVRKEKYESEVSITPLFSILLLFFSLTIFTFSFVKINDDLKFLKQSNDKLKLFFESTKHAEEIGKYYSWNWDLESNKLSFSDNLYKMLGVDPQSFEANVSNFIDYVHPEDKERVASGADLILVEGKAVSIFFRFVSKNGEILYFNSIAQSYIDSSNKTMILGVSRDITEQHYANIAIEERNFELEQINTELESFNHVASHDLQEPLRKIQIFISRISPADIDSLSETGKEYISKIKLASNKMRVLIDDLLLFTRANKIDKAFEKTNLNELLENAKQELAINIHEKNAVFDAKKLPTTNVIPYQIQQLFINLISNSLKYSKEGVNPIITIRCEKVLVSSVSLNINSDKKYYKLSFSDNGIGFEQEFSESIFALFKRLHSKDDLPGTGIGLAICKKIVENHQGAITAEGKLNIGATFNIFLPEKE